MYILLTVAQLKYYTPLIRDCENLDTACFVLWLNIELMYNFSIVLSSAAFLATRSFIKQKVQIPQMFGKKRMVLLIDTFVELKNLVNAWNNKFLPPIISCILYGFNDFG